ncbi:hypothetical protein E1218_31935 [Kribbella turkmenica]|uniref:MFS transporter n=1 Tax=Kribbella turkmenica TaxID=2530375 RepID=A0A4V2YDF6_9ACTN|nr:hypothetical protein [Kribbella turkmenica]TDD15176.1 hypothetical protein E1218_31935 [Kribbella turkmenica]
MDWTGRRAAAGGYIALFGANWAGVVLVLIGQMTGAPPTAIAGIVLFGIGQAGINVLAFALRRWPVPAGRFDARASNVSRAWHRLTLGLEVPAALRALRNS